MAYLYLVIAIIAEVIATSALKSSEGFTRILPSFLVVTGYGISFYCLAMVLKVIPVGITYAIWSGVGIVLITLVGYLFFNQKIDLAATLGMSLIILGVVVIFVFSKTTNYQ